ncbi:hypothetical protein B0920_03250 [Massilia sp. KIM]|uniref:NAD(P)H-dependent oxidoreductase n=1 Tax=Massilia sp. KIM TaxID=1955422 RepID=UPI0009D08C28|nr:NAD(P)H-dependent oxidoreductase [Massilia sp. KIM]OON62487.1 hypothetical protein B0920_03250 [Massilia sp. KIM]
MTHVLVVNSSVSGNSSVSRTLVGYVVERLMESQADISLTCRDVGETVIPHLTAATVAGVRAVAESQAERSTADLSDTLIAELQAADLLVIGAPMYNFSIPSSLRAWFDHVLRPRVTFAYGANGPEGLLKGKRAIVVETRGGLYSEGPSKAIDFQEPYLTQLLGFIGINHVDFIRAEKIGYGPEARAESISAAKSEISSLVSRVLGAGDRAASPKSDPSVHAEEAVRPSDANVDYDFLLTSNLTRVFNERDASRRLAAVKSIYHKDAEFYEPGQIARGHEAIAAAVTKLLANLPADTVFRAVRPAVGHHGIARLQWSASFSQRSSLVTGTDVVEIKEGLIRRLHVFIDQA